MITITIEDAVLLERLDVYRRQNYIGTLETAAVRALKRLLPDAWVDEDFVRSRKVVDRAEMIMRRQTQAIINRAVIAGGLA